MSAATDTQVESAQQWDTLQRVILPNASQMDTVPLYMDMGTATGIQLPTVGEPATARRPEPQTFSSSTKEAHVEDFLSRQLHQGPVRGTGLVRHLLQRLPGELLAALDVGGRGPASGRAPRAPDPSSSTSPTPAGPCSASTRGASTARRRTPSSCPWRPSATAAGTGSTSWPAPNRWSWSTPNGRAPLLTARPGRSPLQITTLNKTDFCLNNLRLLAENPDALEHVQEILLVDQGTQKVEDAGRFRRGPGIAWRQAADHQPVEPRRLRRLCPRHVRGRRKRQ